MSVGAQLRSAAIGAYLGDRSLRMRRALYGVRRVLGGGARTVVFYHQIDDPYSHLLAQKVRELVQRFPSLKLDIAIVPAPAADADPEPELRRSYALRDAQLLAEHSDLSFPASASTIPDDRLRRAHAVLLLERPTGAQLDALIRVGEALWSGDAGALTALVRELGAAPGQHVRPRLEESYRRLRKAGHYQGAMLHYAGEWYWGVDRIDYLVARLVAEGLGHADGPMLELARRPPTNDSPTNDSAALECYFSFRSPYSYLALVRLAELAALGVEVKLQPVMPMVSRGLPVPKQKQLYLALDAKREAHRHGTPFGRICDPLGLGVERCMAVFHELGSPKRELAFAVSAMRGIWSEALDMASDKGLVAVASRAGIDEQEVHAALGSTRWRAAVEENRVAMLELGLWGVPTIRHGELAVWGQDRLWLIEDRLGLARSLPVPSPSDSPETLPARQTREV